MSNEELVSWLATLFDEPRANFSELTLRADVPGWDSLGMLTLMAELDEKFGIQLSEQEIQSLQTVGDVLGLIANRSAR